MTTEGSIALLATIAIIVILYFLYSHILFSKIDKPYVSANFEEASRRIDKYYKWLPFSHQKLTVYRISMAILTNDDEKFVKYINLINRKSHTYGPYYFYYNIAYAINHDDFVKAEKLYGDLTTRYNVSKELDLVTPLAILMANKGDQKAYKKLKELKRNNHIDITFLNVANRYIRKCKKNGREDA